MLNIILFGPPGSGKGTQSQLLQQQYQLNYISTGEALRHEIKTQSQLGIKAKAVIESGGLVDDEIIVQIIRNNLQSGMQGDGFLFDGFPRTYVQAYILDGLFTRLHTNLSKIFILDVPDEICHQRLLQRANEQNRSDDKEDVIRKRLEEYHQKTKPLLEFYQSTGKVVKIDGLGSEQEVFARINDHISAELKQKPVNIILFGYPGAGRGTQATKLAERFNLQVLSTGQLLQKSIEQNTPLSSKIKPFLEKGLLVPDELVIRLIEKELLNKDRPQRGFIFKGYPRTFVQAYILDGILKKTGQSVNCVVNLQTPMLELVKRLDARAHTKEKMPYDGNAASIVARLEEHAHRTEPVLEYYAQQGLVINVDGDGSVDEVFKRLQEPVLKTLGGLR